MPGRRPSRRLFRFAAAWALVLFLTLTAGTATHAYFTSAPMTVSSTGQAGTVESAQAGLSGLSSTYGSNSAVSATLITVTNTGTLDSDVRYTLRSSSRAVSGAAFSVWSVASAAACSPQSTPPSGSTVYGSLPPAMTGYLTAGAGASYCLKVEMSQAERARHSGSTLALTGELVSTLGSWTGGHSATAAISIVDDQAPSVPGIRLDRVSGYSTRVSWSASTDDVGVAGYRILRGGTTVATVSAGTTSWTDTSLRSGTSYTWAVEAFDAAGNRTRSGSLSARTLAVTTNAPYYLYFVNGSRCVDASGVNSALGTPIHIWDCVGGANQIWTLRAAGDGSYQFEPTHSTNTVIGSPNANAGQQLQLTAKSSASTRWTIETQGSSYRFVNDATGMCMDISGNGTANGTAVTQWQCGAGNTAQYFTLQAR